MPAIQVITVVQPDGTLSVRGLPFAPGSPVVVSVSPVPDGTAPPTDANPPDDPTEGGQYPLRGTPGYYIDPFKPAWDDDEWAMNS